MTPQEIHDLIARMMPDAEIIVQSEDNTHFTARVVSETFAGQRPLKRHQMVYAALGARMGAEIHALSIEALTPAEVQASGH